MASINLSGGEKLEAYLKDLAKKLGSQETLEVGFLPDATYPDGKPVAMIAAIQEYGAPAKGIPARSFFRTMIAAKSSKWGEALAGLLKKNEYNANKSLAGMGREIAGQLRDSIIATVAPPLSPVTLLLRQRFGNDPGAITFADVQQARRDIAAGVKPDVTDTQSKPLVWTGHMLNSIASIVKSGGA